MFSPYLECCHRRCHSCYSLVSEVTSPRSNQTNNPDINLSCVRPKKLILLQHYQHHRHTRSSTPMAPNILLTGVSGYLGGTLLNEWKTSGPGNHGEISALIRNDEQAKEVAVYSVESLVISPKDEVSIVKALVDREITIVYYLIGSYWLESQFTSSKGSHYVAVRVQLGAGCLVPRKPLHKSYCKSTEHRSGDNLRTVHCECRSSFMLNPAY